jgi:hypothetical protein
MEWITINEACTKYNKSNSSIRRIVAELKKNDKKKIKLADGGKIFISIAYLDNHFKVNTNSQNEYSEANQVNNHSELLELLKQQLSEKDKQIESLIERNRESNILLSQLQSKVLQLDEAPAKKKRWFQRNK